MKTNSHRKMVRKMRFISDQAGIMDRYLREQDHWSGHLERTKQFILDSFRHKKINTLAVLGSGWLLDLPVEELSRKYKELLLVDIHHPPQVRKKIQNYKNVTLSETDLTGGGIRFCWQLVKSGPAPTDESFPHSFRPVLPSLPKEPDAFVSLNLLNQLDILLMEFLERKKLHFPGEKIYNFRKMIQEFHLEWISAKPGCLVTDVAEISKGADHNRSEKTLLHTKLPDGIRSDEWTWDFDLSGTYHPGQETRMKIRAVEW